MAKGENIFKRKDGRWEARYIKGYELSGKIKYGFCYGKTYREAKEKTTKCKAALVSGRPVPSTNSRRRFSFYCDEWLRLRRTKVKESTYIKYETALRKHIKPEPEPSYPLDLTARKVWSSDALKNRPSSVTVTLYNGDVPYETVRLGSWNNWTYTWKDPNAYGNWQVIETNIPKGYVPSYSVSGNIVTVTNTRSLIQTGQLNWPIWVLGGTGLALVALGGAILVKKKENNA